MKYGLILLLIISSGCSHFKKKEVVSESIIYFNETESLFYQALKTNDHKIYEELKAKVRIKAVNGFEEGFLHAAVYSDLDIFKEVSATLININQKSVFDLSPLQIAVERQDYDKVSHLLVLGADVNHIGFLGEPLFFIPLKKKDLKMLQILMNYNFDPEVLGFMNKTWQNFNFASDEMTRYSEKYRNRKIPVKKSFSIFGD